MFKSIRLKDIRKGQEFVETDCGRAVKCRALEDATDNKDRKGYECRALVVEGYAPMSDEESIVHFFEAYDAGAYRLKLYSS